MLTTEQYVDRIMEKANLARRDEKRVRAELLSHIEEFIDAGEKAGLKESEVVKMLQKEFGKPEELGPMIAKAKGRFLTYLKKKARKVTITIIIAIVLALSIRAAAFEAFRVTSDVVVPAVPKNARLLVNKVTNKFDVNDIVVFQTENGNRVGIVKQIDKQKDGMYLRRNNQEDVFVQRKDIIGRAMFIYFAQL